MSEFCWISQMRDSGSDGVNRAGRDEIGLTRAHRNPAQQLLDLAAERRVRNVSPAGSAR